VPIPKRTRRQTLWCGFAVCLLLAAAAPSRAQLRTVDEAPLRVDEGTPFPEEQAGATNQDPIVVDAQFAQQWRDDKTDTYLLRGQCRITQGGMTLSARQMVVWHKTGARRGDLERLIVYLEGEARIEWRYRREEQHALLFDLETGEGVTFVGRPPAPDVSGADDPVYRRALAQRDATGRNHLQPTQMILTDPPGGSRRGLAAPGADPVFERHVSINPRFLGQHLNFNTTTTDTVPPELVLTVTEGVNIVVTGVPVVVNGVATPSKVDLTADSAVIWTDPDVVGDTEFEIGAGTPLRVYLEGNIIVRESTGLGTGGQTEVRARQAYYDVSERRGLLVDAEVRAFLPKLGGVLRVRAQQVRQLAERNIHAQNAWVSTSQMGRPGYRIEASDIFLQERFDPGQPRFDPLTGEAVPGDLWVTSHNNRLYIENVPVFVAPYLAGPAENPSVPLRRFDIGYNSYFGLNAQSVWNVESLIGRELPRGADWDLLLDGYTERGPAVGTTWDYGARTTVFGMPTIVSGLGRLYYLHDDGEDNLGLNRRSLDVPDNNRGQALVRHRMEFPFGAALTGEIGYLSDRNFLEQYDENGPNGWDRGKDYESLLYLHQNIDNFTFSGLVQGRLNDFDNDTQWLPRGDLTLLGEPLLGGWLNWSTHTYAGFGHLLPAESPSDPADIFSPLPYFTDSSGAVAMTRHELDLPLSVGPVKIVPYLLGEAAYWQEDVTQNDLARLYGSAGIKGSVMFWTVRPEIQSVILGLNGLAHKMVFDFDYYYAQSDEPLSSIPQYNPFDDNAQERFRSRFIINEFGGVLPAMFDPRFYAVRSGAGRGVTAPWHELVDDMQVLRVGWRHRWQTKAGPPTRPRIEDWMTLDLEASWFPDADRDNFGENFGLLGGRYAWYVGERTVVLADAIYDLFAGGQELWNLGVQSQRSERGSVYLGYRQVNVGPIESQLLAASYSYAMGPKWVTTFGTSYDVAEGIDRGQSFTITRVGEYALLHIGLGYDRSRDNIGFGLSIEPRLGGYGPGSSQLSSLLGIGRPTALKH
jgi:hypothetical protein